MLLAVVLQTAAFAYAVWQLRPNVSDESVDLADEESGEWVEPEPRTVAFGGLAGAGAGVAVVPLSAAAAGGGTFSAVASEDPAFVAGEAPVVAPGFDGAADEGRLGWRGYPGFSTWLDAKLGTA